ncbi:hypothetical protein [Treponema sp.]|uniref:hypothetical protein n=1 Tax=Treponema sp. TaxID=166 RepID=UPI00298D663B|nr:hypothetical protein [Treponema sp.]MCQ2240014.1 hypothetical protein [Treponema sp.]
MVFRLYLAGYKSAKALHKFFFITSELDSIFKKFRDDTPDLPVLFETDRYSLAAHYYRDYYKEGIQVVLWKEGDPVPLKPVDPALLEQRKFPEEVDEMIPWNELPKVVPEIPVEEKKLTLEEKELEKQFYLCKIKETSLSPCIDWAITQLEKNNSTDDICILAGLDESDDQEVLKYVQKILGNSCSFDNKNKLEEYGALYLAGFAKEYFEGKIKPGEFSIIAEGIYINAEFPKWMEKFTKNNELGVVTEKQKQRFESSLKRFLSAWEQSKNFANFRNIYLKKRK